MRILRAEDLTISEAHELFSLAMESVNMLVHDMLGPFGRMQDAVESVRDIVAEGMDKGWSEEDRETLGLYSSLIGELGEVGAARIARSRSLAPRTYRDNNQFIADPAEILKTFSNFAIARRVKISAAEHCPDVVLVYPYCSLYALFNELVSNAIEHNDKAGMEVTIGWRIEEDRFVGTVADNGPGIVDALDQDFIAFDQMRRGLRDKRKREGQGQKSDVGLNHVWRLLHRSGGYMRFASNGATGTVAEFTLPVMGIWHADALPPKQEASA